MKKSSIIFTLLASAMTLGAATGASAATKAPAGAVFAATNDVHHNSIVMYNRSAAGALTYVGMFETGGRGEGGINDPLQSESSLLLSGDHHYLLAVNAGSSTISVFAIAENGLSLLDVEPSGGGNPVSVAMFDDLVYVANVGGIYHTAGFRLLPWGKLEPIANSIKTLSGLDTEPGTIAFSPDGTKLVVTERQTSKVDVFSVQGDGSLANGVFNAAQGVEPFGMQFAPNGVLLVSEAGSSAVSSYVVNADNTLTVVTSKSPSPGAATCWVATNGSIVWASNAASSNITAYTLGTSGALAPLGTVLKQAAAGPTIFPPIVPATAFPIDLALTEDSKFLYVVYSALGQIIGYKTGPNGQLTQVTAVNAYAPQVGVEGLAVY